MDLKKLEYFLTVSKVGNITKAAQILYMAQPPLSYQIKAFEQELGVQLIEKNGRNIKLTEHGRLLYERGPLILEMVSKTVQELHELTFVSQNTLTIGNASPWGYTILPYQIKTLNESHPHTNFRLWQGDTHRVMELLNSGVIEVGFITFPTSPTTYESKPLNIEPLCAFFGKDYDYGRSAQHITLDEIATSPTIIIHHHMYDLLSAYYKRVGLKPKLLCHNDTISMLDWAASEPWIIIGPKSIFDLNPRANINCKPIVDPPFEVISYIIWLKNHNLSKAARHFIEMIFSKFEPETRMSNTDIYQVIGDPSWLKKRELYRNGPV